MKKLISKLALAGCVGVSVFLLLGAGISAYKSMMLTTGNALPNNETNFFTVNSNLLNASVGPAVLPAGVITNGQTNPAFNNGITITAVGPFGGSGPVDVLTVNATSGNITPTLIYFLQTGQWTEEINGGGGITRDYANPSLIGRDTLDTNGNYTVTGNIASPSNIAAASITLGTNAPITNWPSGGGGGSAVNFNPNYFSTNGSSQISLSPYLTNLAYHAGGTPTFTTNVGSTRAALIWGNDNYFLASFYVTNGGWSPSGGDVILTVNSGLPYTHAILSISDPTMNVFVPGNIAVTNNAGHAGLWNTGAGNVPGPETQYYFYGAFTGQ